MLTDSEWTDELASLLTTPRTVGWLFEHDLPRDRLPAGTVVAMGRDKDQKLRAYYWIPTGSQTQANALNRLEIDIPNARLVSA